MPGSNRVIERRLTHETHVSGDRGRCANAGGHRLHASRLPEWSKRKRGFNTRRDGSNRQRADEQRLAGISVVAAGVFAAARLSTAITASVFAASLLATTVLATAIRPCA